MNMFSMIENSRNTLVKIKTKYPNRYTFHCKFCTNYFQIGAYNGRGGSYNPEYFNGKSGHELFLHTHDINGLAKNFDMLYNTYIRATLNVSVLNMYYSSNKKVLQFVRNGSRELAGDNILLSYDINGFDNVLLILYVLRDKICDDLIRFIVDEFIVTKIGKLQSMCFKRKN
jgi:hypothetical protein